MVEDDLNGPRFLAPLVWWLVLFIEALVLFPNVGRKGSNNGQI